MVLTHFSLAGLVQAMSKIVGVFTLLMPKPKAEESTHGEGAKVVAPAMSKPQPEQPAATRILPQPVEVKEWVTSMAEKSELRPRATSLFMGLFQVVKKVLVGIWQLFFGEEKTERPRHLDRQDPEIDGQIAAPDVDDLFLEDGEPWQSDRHKPGSKKEKAEFPPEFDFPTLEEPAVTATTKPKEADPFHIPEVHLRPTPPVVTPTVEQPAVVIVEKKEAVTEPPKVEEDFPEEEEEEIIDHPVSEEEEEEDDDTWSDEALELVKQVAEPPGLVQTSFTPAAPAPVQPAPKPRPIVPPPVIGEAGVLPPLDLLTWGDNTTTVIEPASLQGQARLIEQKLADFSVKGSIVEVHPGPVVTTFELDPAPGLKSAKVVGLADDLARSISAASVRVVGNIPGKSVIGIEVPNAKRQTVWLRQILESSSMNGHKSPLAVALGSDITGNPVVGDLARMPHLLVAGTTGSGKSVAVNAMICTILFRSTPDQVQFLMVDPKMLELSIYEGIPHLLAPVVTEVKKASTLLKWAVSEMEDRYRLMSEMGVRNLAGYNAKIDECKANGSQPTRRVKAGFDPETGEILEREEAIPLEHKPLIVIVIDELADLMMQVGKEVEPAIARLAQMARAAGLHLILATQRPSVDVITGLIKANFPTRLAFQVSSRIDSRTILDAQGAEHLLGMGDGLYQPPGTSRMIRIHARLLEGESSRTRTGVLLG
ncbi:MAG: hypothetical protein HQL55_13415, partial [Magnetococcales bacterium]|nr:hypothetical protein [Magnetococcales bacterium]